MANKRKKFKTVREVTLDAPVMGKNGKVMLEKGTHYMHEDVAALLKDRGIKLKIKEFDKEAAVEEIKAAEEAQKGGKK